MRSPLPAATTARGDPAVADPKHLLPQKLTPEAERTETGARNVLVSFARAIEEREFRVAYALFEPALRERISEREFVAQYEGMGRLTVRVPAGRMGGAAGSSYYEAPIVISDPAGRKLSGSVTLRRVNDVPGSTDYARQWHISGFDVE